MSDVSIRYIIAIVVTLICLLAYYAGYISGVFGWWWTAFGSLIIFGGVYKVLK